MSHTLDPTHEKENHESDNHIESNRYDRERFCVIHFDVDTAPIFYFRVGAQLGAVCRTAHYRGLVLESHPDADQSGHLVTKRSNKNECTMVAHPVIDRCRNRHRLLFPSAREHELREAHSAKDINHDGRHTS